MLDLVVNHWFRFISALIGGRTGLKADDARRAAEAEAAEDARRTAEAKAAEDAHRAAEARVAEEARRVLLSGRSADGLTSTGPIVCACFSVGLATIRAAIETGAAASVEGIGAALRAGTNCGSCLPELKRIVADAGAGAASSQATSTADRARQAPVTS